MNLANNARYAMKDQGGSLTIRTTPISGAPEGFDLQANVTGFALIEVEDTGTGMSLEVQQRVFEALFSTKPSGEGTGLGLSSARVLLQNRGGDIRVKSELGIGTCFTLVLPADFDGLYEDGLAANHLNQTVPS